MDASAKPLIQLDGITKVFLTDEVETHALGGIHLSINTGEYVAISGPSGCGKTTLLSLLGLLDSPTEGTYYLDGDAQVNAAEGVGRIDARHCGCVGRGSRHAVGRRPVGQLR